MKSPLQITDSFEKRHIGINQKDLQKMLAVIGVDSLDKLIDNTIPKDIRRDKPMQIGAPLSEFEYLKHITAIAAQNKVYQSFIGMGYYGTITPAAIRRNIFENPGWYTQYTPYQAEIAQGRLEALLNFQTMVSDLTGFPIANASLLDEGTAAAEAMSMFWGVKNKKDKIYNKFFVSELCFPQTIAVVKTRAAILDIEIIVGNHETIEITADFFGALVQYPAKNGEVIDYSNFVAKCHEKECYVTVAADLMALALYSPPAEWGADCAVGNTQRFGVPMGFGGPHAAYFATKEEYKRIIPGRIIGISIDAQGNSALRMALQTREQHIRREKATSNICTAQALLAIMAGMYAVYHGGEGIKNIATRIHLMALIAKQELAAMGYTIVTQKTFDTICILADTATIAAIQQKAVGNAMNFYYESDKIYVSFDETVLAADLQLVLEIFAAAKNQLFTKDVNELAKNCTVTANRTSTYLTHPVFNSYHSESELMRYIKSLENKDLSLTHSMISLGSCTMKLNAAAEMEPLSWAAFANIHPFAPSSQTEGYISVIKSLEKYLADITGFAATSLQPNSGAQGEYAGIQVIRAYQKAIGQEHRNIALIPASAHGTNPATAVMCGLHVIVVNTDEKGNIDMADLNAKAVENAAHLCCLMVTYPSTHGVFEKTIKEVCNIIHNNGGQVYMDGANLNAQVGITGPGFIGADVNHINLHKTFAIPHGGGGPGMGPICVAAHLAPFLPSNPIVKTGGDKAIPAISSAPYGSASILLISYAYIKMLGDSGLTAATKYAILNANYLRAKLEKEFDILYKGDMGNVAHELIVDFRKYKHTVGIEVEDVAKRLMDYGFHAPTVSFPVAGTLMIEPTESEDKAELDRFVEALVAIKNEIEAIQNGSADKTDNVLKNSPHTMFEVMQSDWKHSYSREQAAFPLSWVAARKFWPSVGRVNNSHGDRNLICTCASIEEYR